MIINFQGGLYAMTINNKELTDTMRSMDTVIECLHAYNLVREVKYISVERNEINENIHYHLLVEDVNPSILNDGRFWVKELPNEIEVAQYCQYLKKDGHYKIVHPIAYCEQIGKIAWYDLAYQLVLSDMPLKDIIGYDTRMVKHIHQLVKLYEVLKPGVQIFDIKQQKQ